MSLARTSLVCALALAGAACGATPMHLASLDEVDRTRASAPMREVAERAPEAYARAEQERDFARTAHAARDDVAANLHAERALAAYEHATAVARLATATAELAEAKKALDDTAAQEQVLAGARTKLDLDAEDLERQAQLARDRLLPAQSGVAPADREAARLAAARSIATEARLLCGAAQLAGDGGDALAQARDGLEKVEARLAAKAGPADKSRPAAVDEAATARAQCLDALTRARRAAAASGQLGPTSGRTDALLTELSASGGWDPTRDERGVVVTLRGAFTGADLTDEAKTKLESLGRVASAHAGFGVQVVIHDAVAPSSKDDADAKRADAVVKALVDGGAPAARVKSELAGARAPVVDPQDPRLRARNERVDVVFVGGG